jgi:hypothetical protein
VIIEVIAIAATGIFAVTATLIVAASRSHKHGPGPEAAYHDSGEQVRVEKSDDGRVKKIEIVNPSAEVRRMLDV